MPPRKKQQIEKEIESVFPIAKNSCFISENSYNLLYSEWEKTKNTKEAIVEWFIKMKLASLPNFKASILKCNKQIAIKQIDRILSYGESIEMIISILYYSCIDDFWAKNLFSVSQLTHSNPNKAMKYEYIKNNLEGYIKNGQ